MKGGIEGGERESDSSKSAKSHKSVYTRCISIGQRTLAIFNKGDITFLR